MPPAGGKAERESGGVFPSGKLVHISETKYSSYRDYDYFAKLSSSAEPCFIILARSQVIPVMKFYRD